MDANFKYASIVNYYGVIDKENFVLATSQNCINLKIVFHSKTI